MINERFSRYDERTMDYEHLLGQISKLSGYPKTIVREVLGAVPDGLLALKEEESVRTPLGVFRMVRKKSRKIRLPGSDQMGEVRERLQIRMTAGKRLKIMPSPKE